MELKKRGTLLVFVVLFLVLFLSNTVVAESGCFLYPGTEDVYCQQLLREDAQDDCGNYDDCNLATHFIANSDCSEFPVCERVTCNVDCQIHRLGFCEQLGLDRSDQEIKGASVPSEEQGFWCRPFCCQVGEYCSGRSEGLVNRWECQRTALRQGYEKNDFQEHAAANARMCIEACGIEAGPGSISGTVLLGDLPAKNAVVKLQTQETTTDINGAFKFENLAPRAYIVTVRVEGYGSKSQEARVVSSQATIMRIVLTPMTGVEIAGRVTQADTGQGLQAAVISWQQNGQIQRVESDQQGTYLLNVPPGDYIFTASKRGFSSQEKTVSVTNSQTVDYSLSASAQQGIRGRTLVERDGPGEPLQGVVIYVNGIWGGFSQPARGANANGFYEIELAPGTYEISATFLGDYAMRQPVSVTVTDGQWVENELILTRSVAICGPNTEAGFKPVEIFSGRPILGDKKIKLEWQKPCPEVSSYEITRTCEGCEAVTLRAAKSDSSFIDEVDWGTSYRYEIKAIYVSDNTIPSAAVSTDLIYSGDEICGKKYDPALSRWTTFCQIGEQAVRQTVWTCNFENRLVESRNCAREGDLFYCSPSGNKVAICKDAGICSVTGQRAEPFGMYHERNTCYGSTTPKEGTANYCYYDHTQTVVDQCQACTEVVNCFDYQSQDSCEINNCLTASCRWVEGAANTLLVDYNLILPGLVTPETGHGYCVQDDYQDDDKCSLCGSESALFENYYCTAEVCSGLGQCFSQENLRKCESCGEEPTVETNCYSYQTELECIGDSNGFKLAGDEFLDSDDKCSWNRCQWDGASCFKDGDANNFDDCAGMPRDEQDRCRTDLIPPTTTTEGTKVISKATPKLLFSAEDDFSLKTLHYCLVSTAPNAQDFCDDFSVAKYQEFLPADSIAVDLLAEIGENVDGETYRIKYYSTDRYFNQEERQETFVYVDNVAPKFEINEDIVTTKDKTNLEVFLEGLSEEMSCEYALYQKWPLESVPRTASADIHSVDKRVTFSNLPGIQYNLSVSCSDENGNVNNKEKWYTFDLEQGINIINPPPNGAVASTRIKFEISTDVSSACELRTFEDQPVTSFIPDGEFKNHVTAEIGGFREGQYFQEYKVVCSEILDPTQEHTDYFSFIVDFTGPETQIILQEGVRSVEPTKYNWEESFVRGATASFTCTAEGFPCDKTRFCLGPNCHDRDSPNYREYSSSISLNASSRICYYSIDSKGNRLQPFCGDVLVVGYGITLVSPPQHMFNNQIWGVSNKPTFDWQFFTKVPTTECRFDFVSNFNYQDIPPFRILEGSDNTYNFPGFPGEVISSFSDKGSVKTVYMRCRDLEDDIGPEQQIFLEYDPSAPEIREAFADPNQVLEGTKTTLFVKTDDKTLCKYSDNSGETGSEDFSNMEYSFPGEKELKLDHQDEFSINFLGGKKNYQMNMICMNGAGDLSQMEKVNFLVDYTAVGNIISTSPTGFLRDAEVTLEVITNKNAQCTIMFNGTSAIMDGRGSTVHTKVIDALWEKTYQYPVNCLIGDHEVESTIRFTIDRIAPTITVDDFTRTCNLNEANFITSSNEKNISAYSYELYEQNFKRTSISDAGILANGTISVYQELKISGLNLTEGNSYFVKVRAADAAGNWGEFSESDGFLAVNNNDTNCTSDKEPPIIEFLEETTCTDVTVTLNCKDSNGCTNKQYGTSSTEELCEPTQWYSGQPILLEKSTYVCFSLSDSMGNNRSETKLINFADDDGDSIYGSCDLCPNTNSGRAVDESGCALGDTPLDDITDSDNDGLPDFFEKQYAHCGMNYLAEDTDENGVIDADEDFDGDGSTNYQEFIGSTNPCRATDAPTPATDRREGDDIYQPPAPEGEIIPLILGIIGLLMVIGGIGYLYYFYSKKPQSSQAFSPAARPTETPKWFSKSPVARQVQASKKKSYQRKQVFGEFSRDSPMLPKVDKIIHKDTPDVAKIKELATHYAEHKEEIQPGLRQKEKSVFSKLSSIAKESKDKKIEDVVTKKEAGDIFSKLKKLSKERKK